PGACIVTLGVDEVEHTMYGKADKVVLDDREMIKALKPVIQEGYLQENDIYALIHEIVAGAKPGREQPDERVVIRTGGLVSQDIAVAYRAYTKAVASGITRPLSDRVT